MDLVNLIVDHVLLCCLCLTARSWVVELSLGLVIDFCVCLVAVLAHNADCHTRMYSSISPRGNVKSAHTGADLNTCWADFLNRVQVNHREFKHLDK
jgi:hypothetical protein